MPALYFFLSYSHSAPLASRPQENPDELVDRFFRDLTRAVRDRASLTAGDVDGFYDQRLLPGSDWKRITIQALSAAQVFVPLYSIGYLTSAWPGREFACFRQRVRDAGRADPVRRVAPVLWAPLAGVSEPPGLHRALYSAAEPDYAENGLRYLLRNRSYHDLYAAVVSRLAEQIVDIAEGDPIGPAAPSDLPDIEAVPSENSPDAPLPSFDIEIAAPTAATVPAGRSAGAYGESALLWRPFPGQELPLAEYAKQIIERFDFDAKVSEAGMTGDMVRQRPGIIVIDSAFAATATGRIKLASLAGIPRWVLPLLVCGEPHHPSAHVLTSQVRSLLREDGLTTEAARRGARGIESLDEFVSLVPVLVAEAERQYLRHHRSHPASDSPVGRSHIR